jgi:transposase
MYADKQAHLLDCLQVAARHPDTVVLVFIDEMGFFRWPQGGLTWMPSAPVPNTVLPCAGNNRQWRLIGALNALTGQVTYLDNYIVGRRQVGELYERLDQAYPLAQPIFVVQDNWSIHTHPDVLNVLAALPRLETVSLPTYAHWLNPIEKLWRWLRQDVLRLHQRADDWPMLLSQVHAFLDQFAQGSRDLLRYVGLLGDGKLATALRSP